MAKYDLFGNEYKNQNYIHDEVKRSLKPRNTCYHSVQNIVSPM
jgi:hypothetical protein